MLDLGALPNQTSTMTMSTSIPSSVKRTQEITLTTEAAALFEAVSRGDVRMMELLVDRGANINAIRKEQTHYVPNTPIMESEIIRSRYEAPLLPTFAPHVHTPLDFANSSMPKPEVIHFLTEHGALTYNELEAARDEHASSSNASMSVGGR